MAVTGSVSIKFHEVIMMNCVSENVTNSALYYNNIFNLIIKRFVVRVQFANNVSGA